MPPVIKNNNNNRTKLPHRQENNKDKLRKNRDGYNKQSLGRISLKKAGCATMTQQTKSQKRKDCGPEDARDHGDICP